MTKYTDFVNYHLFMLQDQVRVQAYRRALRQTVRPGHTVLDVGCGSGILAFLACRAGARHVYAIESEDVIEVAKQVCLKNGLQDRITFVHEVSFHARLPEPVDVLVTETMGPFGLDEGLLGAVVDARDRFLKPGGAIIPRAVELFMVPVELPGFYQHMVDFWADDCHSVDFSPVRYFAANNIHPVKLHGDSFLSGPLSLVRVRLPEATSADVLCETAFYATRRGRLHGLAGWFAAELSDETGVTNAPDSTTSHWGTAFFPLERPVPVERGACIAVRVQSSGQGTVWRWHVAVNGREFDQETPWGLQQHPDEPHKLSTGGAPALSRKGQAEFLLLGLLDGTRTINEIELEILRRYPDVIGSKEQASALVRDAVLKYA